jgi:putative transposase
VIKSVKIRLSPTKEQEILMFQSVGIARFAYNWGLSKWEKMYKEGLKPSKAKIKKEFNNSIKKMDDFKWLYNVSAQITAQAFADLEDAYMDFFDGLAQRPKFKNKKKSKKSFYVRYDRITFKNNSVHIEKIGKVTYSSNYKIPKLDKYTNPRCHFDGKYWYLTLGFEHGESQASLNQDLSIGIDLGISHLGVVNHLDKPIENINKSTEVRRLKKKLKRLQRQVSRKYEMNKKGSKFVKTNNIIKLERQIKLVHRRLNNIRTNHIHQATSKMIKLNPYRVVMEDLNVSGMMKNKHLAEKIAEQKFYEFKRQMKYKCQFNKIEFVLADRWYPSSKTCSCCKNIKKDLKLSDRTYTCNECGLVIDRDKNASINLGNYKLA